jgi:hypothetical protein
MVLSTGVVIVFEAIERSSLFSGCCHVANPYTLTQLPLQIEYYAMHALDLIVHSGHKL